MTRDELMELGRRADAAKIECMARLGVITDATDLHDVWMDIWPRVYSDRIVAERAEAGRTGTIRYESRFIEVVNAMSKTERIALRDRVLGVKEFPKPASAS
jgi:hypothetical protein